MSNPVQAIGTIAGAVLKKRAADKQEQAVRKAAEREIALQKQMYEEDIARQQPYLSAGSMGVNRLAQLYGDGGAYTMGPTREALLADPLYAAGLDESIKALERSAAARGNLLSGGTIRGVRSETLQGLQNAFLRNMAQRQAETSALFDLGAMGQASLGMAGQAGRAYAGGVGAAMRGIGQAQADRAAQVGGIYQTALGDALSGYEQYRNNQLQPYTVQTQRTSSYGPYGGSAIPWRSRYGRGP